MAAIAAVAVPAAVLMPMVLPILSPPRLAVYAARLGGSPRIERGKTSPLPQWLADRTGWESFVDDVAQVYRALPPADQARAVLYAASYGTAGALEELGPARGLPRVISNHNTYWYWAQGGLDMDVLIAADADPRDLEQLFSEVRLARVYRCTYCMSWRDEMPIYVARGRRGSLAALWPAVKKFE